jgi:hypothetical protein
MESLSTPIPIINFPDIPQSAINDLFESSTKPPVLTQIAIFQQVPLPTGENLFAGLAQNVGELNISGIIGEAFKLAQVSIGLFGQAFANQFNQPPGTSPLVIINNNNATSVKLIGE